MLSMIAGIGCTNLQTVNALPEGIKEAEVVKEAEVLKELGLFLGTDKGFELDRQATRAHGIVMLIRILGEEKEALSYTGKHPFTDVPSWCDRYVAYAYNKGYTTGTSATTYNANDKITGQQYITFILRALGYNDKNGDFTYAKAIEKAIEVGLVGSAEDYVGDFYRRDIVHISYTALTTNMKDGGYLSGKLIEKNKSSVFEKIMIKHNLVEDKNN
jgi:hypothetical protein